MANEHLFPWLYIALICFCFSVSFAQNVHLTKCINDLAAKNPNSGLTACSPQGSPSIGCTSSNPCKNTICQVGWNVTTTYCGICTEVPANIGQTCVRSDYSVSQPSYCDSAYGSSGRCDDSGKCVSTCPSVGLSMDYQGRCSKIAKTCVVGCPTADHGSQFRYSNLFGSGSGGLGYDENAANDIALLPRHLVTVGSTFSTPNNPLSWPSPLYAGTGVNAYVMVSRVGVTSTFIQDRFLAFGGDGRDVARAVAVAPGDDKIIVVGITQPNGANATSLNFPGMNCNKVGMQTWIIQWSDRTLQYRDFGFCIGKANTSNTVMEVFDVAASAAAFYVVGSQTSGLTGWTRLRDSSWMVLGGGSQDSWIFRYNRTSPLVGGIPVYTLATEFGGSNFDTFNRVHISETGPYDFYVGGSTASADLPLLSPFCTQTGAMPMQLGFYVAGSKNTRSLTSYFCNTAYETDTNIAIREHTDSITDLYLVFKSTTIPSYYYPTGSIWAPTGSFDSAVSIIRHTGTTRTILAGTILRGITPLSIDIGEEVHIVGRTNGPLPVSINAPYGASSTGPLGPSYDDVAYYRLSTLLGKINTAAVIQGATYDEPRAVASYRGFTDPSLAGKLPNGVIIAGTTISSDFPRIFAETSGSFPNGGSFLTAIDNTCFLPDYKARIQTPSGKVLSNEYLSTYEGPAVPVITDRRTRVYVISAGINERTANEKMDYEVFRTAGSSSTTDPNGVGTYLAQVINSISRQTNFVNINIDLAKATSTSNFAYVTTELQNALQRINDDLIFARSVSNITQLDRNIVVIPYTFRLDTRLCADINSNDATFIMSKFAAINNLATTLQQTHYTTIIAATGDYGDDNFGTMASYFRYPLQNYPGTDAQKNKYAIFVSAVQYNDYLDLTSQAWPGASSGRTAFWADGYARRELSRYSEYKYSNRMPIPTPPPISGSPVAAAITAAAVSTIQHNSWPLSQAQVAVRINYQAANGLVWNPSNVAASGGFWPPTELNNLYSVKIEPWRPCGQVGL